MDNILQITFGIIGILIILILGVYYYLQKKRRQDIEFQIGKLGYDFRAKPNEPDEEIISSYGKKRCTPIASSEIKNIVEVNKGEYKICIFDFWYSTGTGQYSQHFEESVFCLSKKIADLPDFEVEHKKFVDRINNSKPSNYVYLDGDSDFLAHYNVYCNDTLVQNRSMK